MLYINCPQRMLGTVHELDSRGAGQKENYIRENLCDRGTH